MKPTFAGLLAVFLLLGSAVPTAAKTIKLATLAPEGSPWYDIIRDMAEAWKELSGGKITVRIYPGGVAGDESDVVRKIRVGQLQAGAISGGGLADIATEIRALQMPMMFRSYEELDFVRARIAPRLEAIFENKGFKILTWGDAGWLYFFTQVPVVYPDDLKSQKLFAWAGNTTFVEAWKDLGYQQVPLAATEIHIGLASKLINAILVPPIASLSFQWFGLAKHLTDLKFVSLVGAIVVSTRTWNSIPDDLRPKLLDAARKAGARLQEVRRLGEEAVEVMKKHGLTVHPVPEDAIDAWERRARLGYPRMTAVVSADLVAEVERLRDEYRASRNVQ